ncbi:ThiF family adenylyltransferase [Candidatus Woesearchaeota archaeon]|nr:ThiF family adenylyltransferase [Candidatus Woesearchaeota archaeon]
MRYIRQEIFKEIGRKGQEKLGKSTAAIVGLGALGSVSAELLARAGIGKIILIDRDVVELSNLQRQTLFDEDDAGKPKASAAKEHLNKINSAVKLDFFIEDLNFENIGKILNKNIYLILDCTDNLETRFLINDFSIKNKIPFIHSSAVGSKGYVFNVIPDKTPCLRCFLKEASQLDTCETAGVLNTITNLIPSIQVNEAIKIMLNKESNASELQDERARVELSHVTRTRSQLPEKNLLFFDVWKNELSKIKINKNNNCICCVKHNFEHLMGKKSSRTVKLCGDNIYQIKNKPISKAQFNNLKNKLKKIGKIIDFS